MTTYNYDRVTARAKAQIDKYGGMVYLKVPVDGKVNAGTGQITYNQITIPVKGIPSGFSSMEVNNVSILENDRRILIATDSGKPLVNNIVEIDNEEYRILEVHEVNPGVTSPIIYKLHVRSTTLAEDLDGFITTVKGLNPGDLIIDPSNPREYPVWVKLVSDYPSQDITMIMEQRPYHLLAYGDTTPINNRWADTDLYRYLNEDYIYNYSADFYDLLQEPLLETRDFFINEKVTVLSGEETTGYLVSGQSSGRQIPYFKDAPFRRIALAEEDLSNTIYWCRDYFGSSKALAIGTDGTLYTYAMTTALAIRACVFLNNNQRVKLNDDGLTYSLIYD